MGHSTKTKLPPGMELDHDHNSRTLFIEACGMIEKVCTVDKTFDIPYLGGIGIAGWAIYVDKDYPDYFSWRGKVISSTTPLVIHEWVEYLIEKKGGEVKEGFLDFMYRTTRDPKWKFGPDSEFPYALSHQLAQHLEQEWVMYSLAGDRAHTQTGEDAWNDYTKFTDSFVKDDEGDGDRIKSCPADLYLQPYENEGDMRNLRLIRDAGGPESYMLLPQGQIGGEDAPFYQA